MPKRAELQQGIGTSPPSAFKTTGRNRLVNRLKSKLPYLGDNRALKNHIVTALKNTGDLKTTIKKYKRDSRSKNGGWRIIIKSFPNHQYT